MFKRFLLVLSMASVVQAQERTKPLNPRIDSLFPDTPAGYLTDVSHVVKNPGAVNAALDSIRQAHGLNIVAVTLPAIGDFQPYEVAMEIGRKWMVANKNDTLTATTRNTGAVMLIVTGARKCYIASATGTEGYLTDNSAANLCRDQREAFRASDFGAGFIGMAKGIAALDAQNQVALASPKSPEAPSEPFNWTLWLSVCGVVMVLGVVLWFKSAIDEEKRNEERRIREAEERREWQKQEAERLERERIWAEERRKAEAEAERKDQEYLASLTPTARKKELKRRQDEQERRERLAAQRRAEEEERARLRRIEQEREDEERRRRSSYSSYSSYDNSSSSSSSSDTSSWSSGGSDSFSGGGGGDTY